MAANPQEVAQQFVQFYYQTFDANRGGLNALYRDSSMLTFESTQTQGAAQIAEKLVALPFQKVQHQVATTDVQPGLGGGILVMVTGALLVDDQQQPMSYAQTFQLAQDGGNWFVQNDIFKLVYPAS